MSCLSGIIKKKLPCLMFLTAPLLWGHGEQSFFISREIRLPLLIAFISSLLLLILLTYMITLIKQRKRNKRLMNNANETILICDIQGKIKECISDRECGSHLKDLFGNENAWEIREALQSVALLGDEKLIRLVLKSQNDERDESYHRMTLQNMLNSRLIRGISVTIEDISESKILENRLIRSRESAFHEARHDHLTSIPNRLYFTEAIIKRFARLERHREESLWLLMIDIDFFKNVNDSYGHDVGDKVLIRLSEICTELIRSSDVFARFGGEEFICYMDDLSEDSALDAAERMRLSVEEFNDWPRGVHLTISIGLAQYTGEHRPEDLIKKADIALYNAKALGRNRVCLYLPMG